MLPHSCHSLLSSLNMASNFTASGPLHTLPAGRILLSASSHSSCTSLRSQLEWTLLSRNSFYSPHSEGVHTEPVKTEWFGISGVKEALWVQNVPGELAKVGNLLVILLSSSFLVTVQFCVHLGRGLEPKTKLLVSSGRARGWVCSSSVNLAGRARAFTVALVLS